MLGVVVEKSKSSLLSSSMLCVRQMVLRVGFKFKLATARVRTPRPSRLLMALLAGCGVQVALALPQGGQVTSGNVTIGAPAGNSLNITQTTDKGIINWQSFNVGSGEKVNFQQPGATSSTLNRVIGSDPTSIFGQINANGQVFLINNSGVLFGPGAQVNAAGLAASTLQLSDGNYLAGNYVFNGAGGSVVNQGVLKAGFVALVGSQVNNTGSIVANGGTAALAAGDRVTLDLIGNDLVSMSVDAPTAAALVHAGGIVQADGGQVLISAKAADALLGTVVNVDGIVQAHSIGSRNGVITLDGGGSGVVAVSGTLDASGQGAGQAGGSVKVLGHDVGLFDHASVDVSGAAGGGLVRIGGDWHGKGADGDANASQAYVGANATIHANATTSGQGGDVVVWSNDHTQFFGNIDARGGAAGGDGGNVETSGHVLHAKGSVDASSKAGKGGNWLLDPVDVTIESGAAATDIPIAGSVFTSDATHSTIRDTVLGGALSSGTNIEVQTGTGAGTGGITVTGNVATALTGTQSATLSLEAVGNITFTGGSISSGTNTSLTLNLNAGTKTDFTAPGTNASTITMDSASSITLGTGGTSAVNATALGAIHLSKITVGDTLTVNSNGGVIDQETGAGAALNVGGVTSITAGAANVRLNNGSNTMIGDIQVTSTGLHDVVLDNNRATSLGAMSLGSGRLTVDTLGAGAITQTGAIVQEASATGASFTAGAHSITLDDTSNGFTGPVSLSNSNTRNVTLVNGGDLTLGTVNIGNGTNTITAGTAAGTTLSRGAALTAGSTPTLTVAGASPDATVASYFISGDATSVAIQDVGGGVSQNVTAAGAQVLPSLTVSGALDVTAGGDLSQVALSSLNVTGTTTIHGGAHQIDLSNTGNTFHGLSVNNTGANDVAIGTSSALAFNTSGVGSGALTVITNNHAISQNGGITQESGGGAVLFDAGTSNVNLGHGANDFTGTVSITGTGAGADTLRDANSVTLGTINFGSGANTLAVGAATGNSLTRTSAITTGSAISLDIGGNTVDNSVRDYFTTGSASSVALAKTATTAVDVTATGVSVLPALVVSGNLDLTASGDISQTVATNLNVAGTTHVAGGAHGVDLGHTGNFFGGAVSVSNSGNNNVSIGSSNALVLGTFSVGTGTLGVDAVGTISQNGATTITQAAGAGAASFTTENNAGGYAITLTNGNDFTGAVSLNNFGANNVAITDINALKMGASTVGTGTLGITSNGALTQTGTIAQGAGAGAVTINAQAGSISLGNANTLTGTVNVANTGANNVAVNDTGALALGTVNVGSGTLGLTSGGAITQTGTITQAANGGAVTISAGANAITLTQANNFTGAVGLSNSGANAVSVTDTNAIILGPSTVGTGLLTVNSSGDITQTGDLTTGGAATFNAGTGNVTLPRAGNAFAGVVTASGTSVTLSATGALQANATLVGGTGNLSLTATGALSGPTTVTTTGDITLSTGAALSTGGNLGGRDISLTGTTVTVNNDVTAGRNLTLHSTAGAISQTAGTITAAGTSTLTAAGAGNTIALNGAANSLVGAVTVSGDAVNITDTAALTVNGTTTSGLTVSGNGVAFGPGTTTVGGALNVTAGAGPITQAGKVAVTGTTGLSTTGALTLADPTNVFTGAVTASGSSIDIAANAANGTLTVTPTVAGGGSLTLAAIGANAALAIPAGAINTTGDVSLTADGGLSTSGDITARNVTLGGGALTIGNHITASGTFDATSTSTITETGSGDIHAAGLATINAGSNAVNLGASTNNFSTLSVTGGAVMIVDTDAVGVHLASATSANLTAGAGGAGILAVDGSTTAGDLTLAGKGVAFGAGATSVHGALHVDSGSGPITQTGDVAVTGASTLTAGTGSIALTNAGNDFGGAVTTTGATTALTDVNALTAHVTATGQATLVAGGLLTVDGSTPNLLATGNGIVFGTTSAGGLVANGGTGTITQTGALTTTGGPTLTTSGQDITLTNAGNSFGGVASFNGANVALTTSGGTLAVDGTATGNLTVNGGSVTLGTVTVGGALNATGNGGIGGASPVHVMGTSTLNAGTSAITLNNASNHFGGLVTATGGAVTLTDAAALNVHLASASSGNLTAGGALAVDGATTGDLSASGASVSLGATTVGGALTAAAATGNVAQTGVVAVTGASTLTATAGAVNLANAGNDFGGAVSVTAAGAASLADTNGIALGASTVGGNLSVASNGAITQTGALSVTGTSTLNAGTQAITLANAANDFVGAVTATGGPVSLSDANALTAHVTGSTTTLVAGTQLVADGAMTGPVSITAATADVEQAGALTASLVNVGSAIVKSNAALKVDGHSTGDVTASGSTVTLANGALAVGGNLSATSSTGDITQAGALTVAGTSTLNAGSHAVTLSNAANDFGGAVTATGGTVALSDANALTAHVTASGASTLVAGGALVADGAMVGTVTVTGTTVDVEQAGPLSVTLANAGNAVLKSSAALHVDGSGTGNLTAGGSAVTLGGSTLAVAGNLSATSSAGDITQAGALSVGGTSTLAAGTGNVTLGNAANALAGAVTASGANITLADASPLTAHIAANGSATLTSAGALSVDGSAAALTATGNGIAQAASLTVSGASNFNAGAGDIALDGPGTNLQGAITASGHAIRLTDSHAIDANVTSTGDVVLTSTADVQAKGTFGGGLKVSGAKVSLDQGTSAAPVAVNGKLDVTSSGDTSLAFVTANGAQVTAGGTMLLNGTLKSTAGDVVLKAGAIQGVNQLGALDAAAGAKVTLDTSGSGGGSIGKKTAAPGVIDDQAIIKLLGATGQSGLTINFNAGQSAWFRVGTQAQTHLLQPHQFDFLASQTFFCDLSTCVNVLGQTTAIADSVIANILTAASQDAADAAFGTENLDFAIRKGYVTTIGRVPPGIDEIAGDLGATPCDSRVTSPTAIAAEKACSAGK